MLIIHNNGFHYDIYTYVFNMFWLYSWIFSTHYTSYNLFPFLLVFLFPSIFISFFISSMGEVYLLNFSGIYRSIDTLPVATPLKKVSLPHQPWTAYESSVEGVLSHAFCGRVLVQAITAFLITARFFPCRHSSCPFSYSVPCALEKVIQMSHS